ncbi:MAG TPA: NAD(P)H-quinone oxidoreductase, partial [Acidimicrobiales bacterium]|nr:NAD(P)H-quinone oxidoreductase [Acidimicrobiales bacterium]
MRAVTIVDQTLQLVEHPDPDPGPGEVVLAVRAAGLNPADALQLRGFYPAPPGSPADIPGL